MLSGRHILLIIGGGIAAYKSLELIRRYQDTGAQVTPVLTRAGSEFVTPLSVAALAGCKVHQDLFDLTAEAEMDHIELSRAADLVVVAPATADLMGKMAAGLANDLASTLLMATNKPVLLTPAMNVKMWEHPATQRNLATLKNDGILFVGPEDGSMACGEFGAGRMAEVPQIIEATAAAFADGPMAGKHVIVTSGPTHESIDPVRYIANRSSGAQGTEIARAFAAAGANVTFITGPADVPVPAGVRVVAVTTAREMADAVDAALPAEAAVFAAAVADWRVASVSDTKIKKTTGGLPVLEFAENTDILAGVSQMSDGRPALVVGFAAETDDVITNAKAKRERKMCDWIIANDVSPETGIMGGDENAVTVISESGADRWPLMSKAQVAIRLVKMISDALP
jgi:phosphopantothenoylcysteine decarboxylase/phosphopantothenate--cysteine ligase